MCEVADEVGLAEHAYRHTTAAADHDETYVRLGE